MAVERDIRYELLARLCPNTTGAELRSVCTEAGMFAIRGRRKAITEKDFLDSIEKVIKGYQKFSSTPKYMVSPSPGIDHAIRSIALKSPLPPDRSTINAWAEVLRCSWLLLPSLVLA
mmetsp:Transcript_9150/g.16688  ORF Transcript_9150/g.16688 Transcript_9150/m.16688 type:complete len:117 (+) Transcript_9150:732-1082(+)